MIRFRTVAKVSLYCAQQSYLGPVQATIIYTEKRFQKAAEPMKLKSPDGETNFNNTFKEIILDSYSEDQLLSIDPRLIILAPFTASKKLKKKQRISLCYDWANKTKKIYPKKMLNNALDILSLFILNRFRNISLEETITMLNIDISKSLAVRQLLQITKEKTAIKTEKKTEKKIAKRTARKMFSKGFEPEIIKEVTGLSNKDFQRLMH